MCDVKSLFSRSCFVWRRCSGTPTDCVQGNTEAARRLPIDSEKLSGFATSLSQLEHGTHGNLPHEFQLSQRLSGKLCLPGCGVNNRYRARRATFGERRQAEQSRPNFLRMSISTQAADLVTASGRRSLPEVPTVKQLKRAVILPVSPATDWARRTTHPSRLKCFWPLGRKCSMRWTGRKFAASRPIAFGFQGHSWGGR